MNKNNIYDEIPLNLTKEIFETLIEDKNVKIERIVSEGNSSPEDFWYDQEKNEWVIILKGEAVLLFEDKEIHLKTGDYIEIPAHKKHKVKWTKQNEKTIWLAVHF